MMFNKGYYFFAGSILLSSCFIQASQFESFHPIEEYKGKTKIADEVDAPEQPYLHRAISRGKIDTVKDLINNRVDLNEIDLSCKQGNTPLVEALAQRDESITKLLLNCGASVNLPNKNGFTPIHTAIEFGTTNLVKIILNYNPELNIEGKSLYYVPLASAIAWQKEAVIFLLQKGAILKPEHFELSNAFNLVDALNHKLGFEINSYFSPFVKAHIMKENLIKRADLITYLKTDKKIKKSVGPNFIDFKGEYQTIVDELAAQPEDKLLLAEGPTLKLFS